MLVWQGAARKDSDIRTMIFTRGSLLRFREALLDIIVDTTSRSRTGLIL